MTQETAKHPLQALVEAHQQMLRSLEGRRRLDLETDRDVRNMLFVVQTGEGDPIVAQPEGWSGQEGSPDFDIRLTSGEIMTIARVQGIALVKRFLKPDQRELIESFVGKNNPHVNLEPGYPNPARRRLRRDLILGYY